MAVEKEKIPLLNCLNRSLDFSCVNSNFRANYELRALLRNQKLENRLDYIRTALENSTTVEAADISTQNSSFAIALSAASSEGTCAGGIASDNKFDFLRVPFQTAASQGVNPKPCANMAF